MYLDVNNDKASDSDYPTDIKKLYCNKSKTTQGNTQIFSTLLKDSTTFLPASFGPYNASKHPNVICFLKNRLRILEPVIPFYVFPGW